MAGGISVELKVDGLTRYGEQAKAALQQALAAEAAETVADAQSRAPVKTGFLRDHISWQATGDLEVEIESAADYSLWVDQGSRHASAQPFFTPAVDQVTQRFPERVKAALAALEGEKLP